MNELKDKFGRIHDYLRISLTEKCNLRCTYCMPEDGITLSPRSQLCSADEIYKIAKVYVENGIRKIRLTGGEPLVRKDFEEIVIKLSQLNVELAITTNAILVHKFLDLFEKVGLKKINVSLDTLDPDRFKKISRRDLFKPTFENIMLLLEKGFEVKLNVVLIKGFNDDEIIPLIELAKSKNLHIRFIEFMPFDGNQWDRSKVVSEQHILELAQGHYTSKNVVRIQDRPNDTSRNYRIAGFKGTFAMISSVTNPFCDSCNRIRLTANGRIKNCLFSGQELDLLLALRQGDDLLPLISKSLYLKHKSRAGLDADSDFNKKENHSNNRSMIAIGG